MADVVDTLAWQRGVLNGIITSKNSDGLTAKEVSEIRDSAKTLRVSANLAFAQMAVNALRSKLGKVANWDQDSDSSVEKVAANLRAQRPYGQLTPADVQLLERTENDADRCVYGKLRPENGMSYIINTGGVGGEESFERIKHIAARSEHNQCGNCMEIAARVFMYLYAQNVRPIEYFHLQYPADHAFVVIGRPKGTPTALNNGYRPEQFDFWQEWTVDAMVCDPWALGRKPQGLKADFGTAYHAINLDVVMTPIVKNFTYPVLDYRAD